MDAMLAAKNVENRVNGQKSDGAFCAPPTTSKGPRLFAALEDQWCLILQPINQTTEILVVDLSREIPRRKLVP